MVGRHMSTRKSRKDWTQGRRPLEYVSHFNKEAARQQWEVGKCRTG